MKDASEDLSQIEWTSVTIENIDGLDILVLICKTAEQSINLFKLLKDNRYIFTIEKENGVDCLVLIFEKRELWFQPNFSFLEMNKLRNGFIANVTTAFDHHSGVKVNIEILELPKISFHLN